MKIFSLFTIRSFTQSFVITLLAGLILLLQSCQEINESIEETPVETFSARSTPSQTVSPSETLVASKTPFPLHTPTLPIILRPTERPSFGHTPAAIPNGTVYVYEAGGYGYIPVRLEGGYIGVTNWYNSDDLRGDAKFIDNMTFSPYSNQVVYLKRKASNLRELWVASVDLSDARLVWTDNNNLLGYSPQHNYKQIITMRWGPGEKFIIITMDDFATKPKSQKNVVIDLQSQSFWETTDYCNHYGISGEKSATISLFCKLLSDEYLVLNADGTSQKTTSLPVPQKIAMQEWRISPDGENILYATEQNDIFIHDQSSDSKLSMKLGELITFDVEMEPLQWSRDGGRLLIWGDENGCYKKIASCWQVIDTKTKNLLWKEAQVYVSGPATLSPNGKQVLRVRGGTAMTRASVITDIATNSTVFIIDAVFEKVAWVDQ